MKKENMIFRLKLEIGGLVNEMVAKLPYELFSSDSTTFLDPSMASGQYVTAIEQRLRKHGHSDENIKSRVFGVEKNMLRVNYAIKKNKLVGTYSVDKNDIPSILIGSMKFDCIVGNPPYQKKTGPNNTEALWNTFVEASIKSLKEGGYLCYVHPSGWRNVDGRFKSIQKLLTERHMQYLEIHDIKDGIKTFGAETRYDWYVLKNVPNGGETVVKFQDSEIRNVNLKGLTFLPSGDYDTIMSFVAKDGELRCEVMHSNSYDHRKPYMSKTKLAKYIHPIVNLVRKTGDLEFLYSSEDKSQIGVPKVIWTNTRLISLGAYVDKKGEYGMTPFNFGLVDDPKNLNKIKIAMESPKFKKLMEMTIVDIFPGLNRKVLALFRKDFYKDFI